MMRAGRDYITRGVKDKPKGRKPPRAEAVEKRAPGKRKPTLPSK